MTNPYHKKQWWGYTDIGPVQIPPNPQYLILTDRGTGTLWWVTLNLASGGTRRVAINSAFPCHTTIDGIGNGQNKPTPKVYNNCNLFDAFAEPVVGFVDAQTLVRLIVRDGQLGVSVEPVNRQLGTDPQAPPLILIPDTGILGFNQVYATIILDTVAANNGTYVVWVPATLTQTPNPSPVQTYD